MSDIAIVFRCSVALNIISNVVPLNIMFYVSIIVLVNF